MSARTLGIACCLLTLGAGCGDDDSMAGDSGTSDSGVRRDTGGPRDSGDDDTGASDAGGEDVTPEGCEGGPLSAPIPGCSPSVPASTGDVYQDCVDRINQFRADCQCLPPLERWTEGEACADEHAEYDSTRSAHAGFRDGICENGGRGQNECPGWRSVEQTISGCLQSMWDEGPGEPFSEHGHYINMTNPAHSRVACGFYTTDDGRVWAVQNFR